MSFGLYSGGFAIVIIGLIYAAHFATHARTLDRGGCGRTFGSRDSDSRKGDASERSCGMTGLAESGSPWTQ